MLTQRGAWYSLSPLMTAKLTPDKALLNLIPKNVYDNYEEDGIVAIGHDVYISREMAELPDKIEAWIEKNREKVFDYKSSINTILKLIKIVLDRADKSIAMDAEYDKMIESMQSDNDPLPPIEEEVDLGSSSGPVAKSVAMQRKMQSCAKKIDEFQALMNKKKSCTIL